MTAIVIMQPTFLPWIGWFDLLDQADVFILLDDVGFSKQSWQQRNRIVGNNGLQYVTLPIKTAGRMGQLICDTELDGSNFANKIIRTVRSNYAKSKYFNEYFDAFCSVLLKGVSTGKLLDVNYLLITWLQNEIGIDKEFIFSSKLDVGGNRSGHVINLCKKVGAHNYISPAGAEKYLLDDHELFNASSINVNLHVYEHPEYEQCRKPFMAYASALDLIMNKGKESLKIIRSGRRPFRTLSEQL